MDKVKMKRKQGNVYHSPVNPPVSSKAPANVDPRTGEVRGKIMEHNSQENVESWWDIFTEIVEETHEVKQRQRSNPHVKQS